MHISMCKVINNLVLSYRQKSNLDTQILHVLIECVGAWLHQHLQ